MTDLIKALTIFSKYANEKWPTMCEHDTLMIVGIKHYQPSPEDAAALAALGFFWDEECECWASHRFGSA